MGLFNFNRDSGRKVDEATKAQEIQKIIQTALGNQLSGLVVDYDKSGTVRLTGRAMWHATKQKAVLLAGNIQGVEKVDDGGLVVDKSHAANKPAAPAAGQDDDEEAEFYTIQKGDSLSAIAQRQYKDANQWRKIFEANRGVINDPDEIYPGQTLRLPK
jgi:nucleoid-associated protein YgaU